MKNETPQKRKKEEWRAKKSMKAWLEKGRVWDYNDICSILPDLTSRRHFVKKLKELGGIVLSEPTEEAANPLQESSTTSTVTLRVPQMSSSQTEAHGFQTETELRDSSTNGSNHIRGPVTHVVTGVKGRSHGESNWSILRSSPTRRRNLHLKLQPDIYHSAPSFAIFLRRFW
ncbi:hypothetical protein ATANTOWER_031232 [Ataeniobius toweri]|uniref:Uncharacterized protein n=1 Tax=Ataeniobius toweri TaxID=208326 RepID=A0ABU7A4B1_9TELE|nr:hypothetical protein [Ataeniobius toweri]